MEKVWRLGIHNTSPYYDFVAFIMNSDNYDILSHKINFCHYSSSTWCAMSYTVLSWSVSYPSYAIPIPFLIIYEFFIYLYNNDFSVNQKMDYAYAYNAYGVVCTEVEIDVLTGQPQVLRVDILYDCGDR